MNFSTLNHSEALVNAAMFDIPPYNQIGDGLTRVAQQVAEGDCRSYTLSMDASEFGGADTLLGCIEVFANGRCKGIWRGLGSTMSEKLTARRNIDYYRLNLQERIALLDTDTRFGNEDGSDIDAEVQAAFPELAFATAGDAVEITIHIPARY